MKRRLKFLFIVLILVCFPLGVSSQQQPAQKPPVEQFGLKKDVPIVIKADRMSGDRKAGVVVFEGNVVATQENAVLTAQRLTAYFTEDRKISLIVAEENVNFVQGDRRGRCDKGSYFYREKKMIFEGNPIFIVGKDVISGAKIEYDMNAERVVVLSDQNKRVEAVIFPEEGEIGEALHSEPGKDVSRSQGSGQSKH